MINKKFFTIALIIVLNLFLINFVSAVVITIDIKPSFSNGETVYFDYTLISDINQTINYQVNSVCENAPSGISIEKTVTLIPNIPLKETYKSIFVSDNIDTQACTAYVMITYPFRQTASKNFSIITNPSFNFDIKLDKKIFIKGESIKLDYISEVSSPSINASLTLPDKSIQQINLPISINAEQIGTYTLETTASKSGYKTASSKEQFAVIEEEANIKSINTCNANNVCDFGETTQNCPQDCPFKKEKKMFNTFTIIFLVILGLIIIILIIILIIRQKISKKEKFDIRKT
ncbi:MAG: hypothetical protein Q8L29_02350 [archaeon]|nr:hypothetical protein [archaeon]